jgi:cysteinyl-tRNA synthetase
MYFAAGHYRQPIAFSGEALEEAGRAVDRVRELCRRLDPAGEEPPALDAHAQRFFDALADDFNTPAARAVLFEWVTEANRRIDSGERLAAGRLAQMLHVLGLEGLLEAPEDGGPDAQSQRLLDEREAARAAREFDRADRLREDLAERGWEIRDTPDGARLVRRRTDR